MNELLQSCIQDPGSNPGKSTMEEKYVKAHINVKDKDALFDYIADLIEADPRVADKELIKKALYEREATATTGVGHSIALPHAKTEAALSVIIVIITLSEKLDYNSLDGLPIDLAWCVIAPKNIDSKYMKLMAHAARVLNSADHYKSFMNAASDEELFAELSKVWN